MQPYKCEVNQIRAPYTPQKVWLLIDHLDELAFDNTEIWTDVKFWCLYRAL